MNGKILGIVLKAAPKVAGAVTNICATKVMENVLSTYAPAATAALKDRVIHKVGTFAIAGLVGALVDKTFSNSVQSIVDELGLVEEGEEDGRDQDA